MLVIIWSESMFSLRNIYVILRLRSAHCIFCTTNTSVVTPWLYHLFVLLTSDVIQGVLSMLSFVCAYVSRTVVASMESSFNAGLSTADGRTESSGQFVYL
jgi:hypothetical protein